MAEAAAAASPTTKHWPGFSDEAHPEVFNKPPPGYSPTAERKPGQLTHKQIQQFFTEGFLIVENFFTKEELEPVKASIEVLVDDTAQKLYNAGKIKDLHAEAGVFQRLTKLEEQFPGANIILQKKKPGSLTKAMKALWSNKRILNVAEQILGTEDIVGSPVWNVRAKTPKNEATTVPWHQDSGYLDKDSYKIMMMSAWIPLLDANENNGCMQVMRRGHKTGKMATHQCCSGGTWYVMLEEEEMKKTLDIDPENDVVTCPIPYGGLLLFSNLLPHRSLPNYSNDVRWSMDLRWQRKDVPICFYGVKDGIQLRAAGQPDFEADWDSFHYVRKYKHGDTVDEFDTSISGPWMGQWELVHLNQHTDAWKGGHTKTMPGIVG